MKLKPAAPIIKRCARELLKQKHEITIDMLKDYVLQTTGHDFTVGAYAGALRSLLDEPGYSKSARGIYTYQAVSAGNRKKAEINKVLDQTAASLKQMAIVDVIEINDTEIEAIKRIPAIISHLEKLKV